MGTLLLDAGENIWTDFLFAMPRMLYGVARVVDLGGVFDEYNISETPEEADAIAIAADWRMVGKDFRTVLARHELAGK